MTYFSVYGLPRMDSAAETWMLQEAKVLPRSRRLLQRNVDIYKKIVNEKLNIDEIAGGYDLAVKYVKEVIKKVSTAINAMVRKCVDKPDEPVVEKTDENPQPVETPQQPERRLRICPPVVEVEETETPANGCDYIYHYMCGPRYPCPACNSTGESPPGGVISKITNWFRGLTCRK